MPETNVLVDSDPRQLAIQLIDGGRFREAVDLLLPLSTSRPDDATLWRVLGVAQGSAGDLDGAVVSLRHAVALLPTSARSHYHLAVVLSQRREIGEARRHVERAMALDPLMTSARDLSARLATQRAPSRPVGASMPAPPQRSTAGDDIRRGLRSHRVPAGAVVSSAAGYSAAAAGAMTDNPVAPVPAEVSASADALPSASGRTVGEQLASVLHSWSWDGFVCGLTVPMVWVGAQCGLAWAAALTLVESAGWAYVFNHPGVRLTAAAILFRLCIALFLGIRGNALSWFGRPWHSVAEFRVCHRIWLIAGLGLLAATSVVASLATLVHFLTLPAMRAAHAVPAHRHAHRAPAHAGKP